ncbi:MAG: type IX secretion system protein PorQ [Bacteroidetes bacterium]|nr:type IX secretion system protein PorQ [Bacteroidota bacterium]
MRQLLRISFAFLLLPSLAFSQEGGSAIYSFLNIPASARIAALGGTFISVKDNDLNCALQNPAALNPLMDKYLSFSGVSYFDGVKFGDAAFAKSFGKKGTFDVWMHYGNYGSFKEADETGIVSGTFTAADYALSLGWGYQLNKLFSVGVNLKGIYSDYYIMNSWGLAGDLSFMLHDTASGWSATLLARNIGAQLKTYVPDNREPLPLEVVGAVSKKFAHVPARLNLTWRHMEVYDISYIDPNDQTNYDALTGEYKPVKYNFWEKGIRHIIVGTEILLSKNFHLRVAYNFQRRQELLVDSRPRTVGLSFGVGLKISKFIISYGRASYHLAGASNHFSLAVNIGEFGKKKN